MDDNNTHKNHVENKSCEKVKFTIATTELCTYTQPFRYEMKLALIEDFPTVKNCLTCGVKNLLKTKSGVADYFKMVASMQFSRVKRDLESVLNGHELEDEERLKPSELGLVFFCSDCAPTFDYSEPSNNTLKMYDQRLAVESRIKDAKLESKKMYKKRMERKQQLAVSPPKVIISQMYHTTRHHRYL